MRWSPEQISGWLCEQGIKLSHECIYQMIWQEARFRRPILAFARAMPIVRRSRPPGEFC
jgi:IS30 family transposase